MCSLEVLGISDTNSESMFPQGYYETRMPWKNDAVKLPNNKVLPIKRLKSTTN